MVWLSGNNEKMQMRLVRMMRLVLCERSKESDMEVSFRFSISDQAISSCCCLQIALATELNELAMIGVRQEIGFRMAVPDQF